MLEEMLKEYLELKKQEDEIAAKKEELGKKIKEELKNLPGRKYDANGLKASITDKTTFKYDDEAAIVNYIIQKGLSEIYLSKKIDATKFNKELKNEGMLYESVKPYLTKNVSEALSVSENKE